MSRFELAQLNIAKMKEPLDSPLLADFVSSLDRINAVADTSAGFVWRLQTTEGDATSLRPLGEVTLVRGTSLPRSRRTCQASPHCRP